MFPLVFLGQYAALAKTALYAIAAFITAFFGINYIRRGQQIAEHKRQIKELQVKSQVDKQNAQTADALQKKESEIDKKTDDELIDDINKLPK